MSTRTSKKLVDAVEEMLAGRRPKQVAVEAKLTEEAAAQWAELHTVGAAHGINDSQILTLLLKGGWERTLNALQAVLDRKKAGSK